jgi:hypothetical protein
VLGHAQLDLQRAAGDGNRELVLHKHKLRAPLPEPLTSIKWQNAGCADRRSRPSS